MKVLVIRKIKNVAGGIDRSLVKIIPALKERGIEVAFLAANDGYIIPEMRKVASQTFVPEQDLSDLGPGWEAFVQNAIVEYQPDLVDLHQTEIIVSVAKMDKINIPLVGAIHSSLADWITEKELQDLRAALPRLSAIHAVGLMIEQELRAIGAGNVKQIFSPVEKCPWRCAARKNPQDPQLLFVGRADTRKGLDILIRALYLISTDYPQAQLTVIGNTGAERRERGGGTDRPLAQELGVDGKIDWLGIQDHSFVLQKMSESDLLVSASRHEGVPGVILEAHSLALPAVATTASAEAMRFGAAGLLVPVESPFLLSQAIIAELKDPARLLRAEENRRLVLQQRSKERLVDTLQSSFQQAVEGHNPAD